MAIDRRRLLVGGTVALAGGALAGGALAGGALGGFAAAGPAADAPSRATFASACRREDGSYAVALLDEAGRIVAELPLGARAHDIAWHGASGNAVAFARQPGRFALAFAPDGRRPPQLFAPPDDRCFFGHGVFSPDGRLLYATENDLDEGVGRIGIYDAGGAFARVGEMASGGIGPHELILLPDGRTLAVANGGYETLPATGRQAIDIAGMRPSLVFVDRLTGDVAARHDPPESLRPLSIRHLAADARGRVWFGGQWEGSPDATPAVIGMAGRDSPLVLIAGEPHGAALKGYVGSVAISRDGGTLAASAPRAGVTVYIDVDSGQQRGATRLPDGCGIAATADGFLLSSGHGRLVAHADGDNNRVLAEQPGIAFDNHLRRLAAV